MRKLINPGLILACLLLFNSSATAVDHPELKAFPVAKDGMVRLIIVLEQRDRSEEADLKVEIIPGKEMLTDGVNRTRLASRIEARPLPGWGYAYYEVTGSSLTMSTLMAPPEGVPQTRAFVAGESLLIPYNSRLPVVIYAPEGFDIHYRIWSASTPINNAEAG